MNGYSGWTDKDWADLLLKVRREAPTGLSKDEIREVAWSYMQRGPEGGGNAYGLFGTIIAICVDEVQAARCEELQT